MIQVQGARVVSSIALLLVLSQLIASASCNSAALVAEEAQIGQAVALDFESNQIDRTQDSTQQLHADGGETSSKFKLIKFEAFQARFKKHYASLLEKVFRLRQFIASLARVTRSIFAYLHRKSTYFLRINRYSDLTRDELRKKLGQRPDSGVESSEFSGGGDDGRAVLSRQKRSLFGGKRKLQKLEYEVDWRREASPKCLNEPVIDQGECGCCYAIATVRLFEWLHCKQHGSPIKLSEQYLVDCGRENKLDGCREGNLWKAIDFISAAGVIRAEQLPFVGEEQTCPNEVRQQAIAVKSVEKRVIREPSKWASELTKGPLLVRMTLSEDFYGYGGGLFEMRDCDPDDGHFILLVGHGRDPNHNNRPFFLFSNSFGLDYGESGYIRLAADRRASECESYAMSAEAEF